MTHRRECNNQIPSKSFGLFRLWMINAIRTQNPDTQGGRHAFVRRLSILFPPIEPKTRMANGRSILPSQDIASFPPQPRYTAALDAHVDAQKQMST